MRWLLMSILLMNGCSFGYLRCIDECLPTNSVSICKEVCRASYP